jgi:hypothetical protein
MNYYSSVVNLSQAVKSSWEIIKVKNENVAELKRDELGNVTALVIMIFSS